MSNGRILVVDDEPQILRGLRTNLVARGYDVDTAPDGEAALDLAARHRPDIVILDLGLPGIDGLDVIRGLRTWTAVPIIVLSAREQEQHKVAALDAGADDFVTKPFSTPELLARVRAALRRAPPVPGISQRLEFGSLAIDFNLRTVTRAGVRSHLTPKELDVLRYFTSHPNEAVSHRAILQAVWGPDYGDQVDYLRVIVKNLRKKIERRPEEPHFIKTEPWVGYRFDSSPDPRDLRAL